MPDFLNREDALLLVVDVQERLVPAIHKDLYPAASRNMKVMIETAGALGLPILLTEQYPKGLGRTVPEILSSLEDDPAALRAEVGEERVRRGVHHGSLPKRPSR